MPHVLNFLTSTHSWSSSTQSWLWPSRARPCCTRGCSRLRRLGHSCSSRLACRGCCCLGRASCRRCRSHLSTQFRSFGARTRHNRHSLLRTPSPWSTASAVRLIVASHSLVTLIANVVCLVLLSSLVVSRLSSSSRLWGGQIPLAIFPTNLHLPHTLVVSSQPMKMSHSLCRHCRHSTRTRNAVDTTALPSALPPPCSRVPSGQLLVPTVVLAMPSSLRTCSSWLPG